MEFDGKERNSLRIRMVQNAAATKGRTTKENQKIAKENEKTYKTQEKALENFVVNRKGLRKTRTQQPQVSL